MTFLVGSSKLIWTGIMLGVGFYMARNLTAKIDKVLEEKAAVSVRVHHHQYAN